ncbi:hypothetical protein [Ancylobacter sp. SL191]|uniref:hypothetical protein n=1 Tax=Ancylobacter sp. SL191 TaxID=2995166 RepID=UPI00226E5E8D|nr:hypothetical protein [Ancylobacter sp. SL191]WAC27153.1 hypothetical protein OU996_19490 [Ancylobacter sp. SL191]
MASDEPLDVELLDRCMQEVTECLVAEPWLAGAGADGARRVDARLLRLRLARAVLEGAQLYPGDGGRIVAFALDALPHHRARRSGEPPASRGTSRVRPMLPPPD